VHSISWDLLSEARDRKDGKETHVDELATDAEPFSFPSYVMAFDPRGTAIADASEEQCDPGSPSRSGKSVKIDRLPLARGGRKRIFVAADRVSGLAFSPDGHVLAVSPHWNGSIARLYRTNDGREMKLFACPAAFSDPGAVEFSPDGRSTAVDLADAAVSIWKIRTLR
jgi:hypothetical protein